MSAAIVVPCYTEERWDALLAALCSACEQTIAAQVFVVVDHNPALAARLRREIPAVLDRVTVMENRFAQGVSGARNTGALAADTEWVAFLDDDTTADPTWLERLIEGCLLEPASLGGGGAIVPAWEARSPFWFPDEFLWAVGGTPPGQPLGQVRNVWGASMLVRRAAFVDVGGFCEVFGKLGDEPQPEDTELCLRMNAQAGRVRGWMYVPTAVVRHKVPRHRSTWWYFLRRCWSEGAGKAALAARPGYGSGTGTLNDETDFVRRVLTRGLCRAGTAFLAGDRAAAGRVAAIVLGTGSAGLGFATTRLRRRPATTSRRAAAPMIPEPTSPGIPAQRTSDAPVAVLPREEVAW